MQSEQSQLWWLRAFLDLSHLTTLPFSTLAISISLQQPLTGFEAHPHTQGFHFSLHIFKDPIFREAHTLGGMNLRDTIPPWGVVHQPLGPTVKS